MSRFVIMLARAYAYLLGVATGGLLGANFAGFVPVCIEFATSPQKRPDASFYNNWVHGGWWVGVGLFTAAAIMHWWRKPQKTTKAPEEQREDCPEPNEELVKRPIKSRLATIGLFGLCGGFLGMLFGGSLLVLWLSLTYSPFGPETWTESLRVERRSVSEGLPRAVVSTDHPTALYAFCGPIVLGALAGGVMGTFPKAKAYTVDRGP